MYTASAVPYHLSYSFMRPLSPSALCWEFRLQRGALYFALDLLLDVSAFPLRPLS